jgi:hypothetical protein
MNCGRMHVHQSRRIATWIAAREEGERIAGTESVRFHPSSFVKRPDRRPYRALRSRRWRSAAVAKRPSTIPVSSFDMDLKTVTNKIYSANFGSINVTVLDANSGTTQTIVEPNSFNPLGSR